MLSAAIQKKLGSVDVVYYFDLNIKLLALCGLRCSITETVGSFIDKIPTLLANLIGVIYMVLELSLVREAVHLHNTALAAQILSQFVSNIECVTKGFLLAMAVEKLQFVLHELRLLWKRYPPDNEIEKSLFNRADKTLTLCKYYVATNMSCIFAYALPLAINIYMQYQSREINNYTYDLSQIILLVKYPFHVTNLNTFIFLFCCEEFLLIMNVIFWVASDTMFAQVTTHIYLQFKVLKCDLTNLFKDENSTDKEILLSLVERHRDLLRICLLIEDIFSPIIFITVIFSSINMCVNVIGIRETIANHSYYDCGIYLTILMMTLFQIIFYCIFAEQISEETRSLADAVYNLNWPSKDYTLRFYIHFIILRAQRPFYCTAYGFFPIGHQRLTSIIKASFSYYMMLTTTDNK